jgi:hypothetical protein
MTDTNGEVISVQVDQERRPFFYVSHQRAGPVREALNRLGLPTDPSDAGKIVQRDEMDESDDGEEVVVFEKDADANEVQDLLDELTWSMNRVVREIPPDAVRT